MFDRPLRAGLTWLERPLHFAALLLVLRLVFLLGALDPAQERALGVIEQAHRIGSPLPERPLYDREELYTSTAAQAIAADLGLPLETYRFMPYGSGSLLLSLAALPVQSLLGTSALAFKLLPLLVTLAAGLFWFLTVRRWLGGRAAALFGLIYLFAPAMLARTALIAKGDHPEAMALLGAVAWMATRAIQATADRPRHLWAAASGLLAGLALYVSYSSAPILAGLGLVAALRTRLRPGRAWAAFALGLGAGLLPWLAVVLSTGGGALLVYGRGPGSGAGLAEAGARLARLLASGFMAGYDLPGALPQRLAALLWLACVVAGIAVWLRHRRSAPAQALLAALLAHLLSFCLLAPDASSRYLVACYPLLIVASLGILPGSWRDSAGMGSGAGGGERGSVAHAACGRLAGATISALAAAGIASQICAAGSVGFAALARPIAGTDWPLLGEIAGPKLAASAIRSLPEPVRPCFWVGHGRHVFRAVATERWGEACAAAGEGESRFVWEGIGVAWGETGRLWEASPLLAAMPPEPRAALRDGLARYADYAFASALAGEGAAIIEPALQRFVPEDLPAIRSALARAVAVMGVHGARIAPGSDGTAGRQAAPGRAGRPDPEGPGWGEWLERTFGADCLREAAGYALFRSAGGGDPLRLWNPPDRSWLAPLANQIRSGGGDEPLWRGLAAAYEAELATRPPAWVTGGPSGGGGSGGGDGPAALARELERIARGLPSGAAAHFYGAAGRASARALEAWRIRHPGAPRAEAWTWRTAIPREHQEAFAAGLEAAR